MDFIVRIPLVDFDIEQEEEIAANFKLIKEAIKYSSSSFYDVIENSTYDLLDSKLKLKIYKYLKRGRYRAVPFGKWAGVGLGEWGKTPNFTIHNIEEYQAVPKNKRWENLLQNGVVGASQFQLNASLQILNEFYIFFAFVSTSNSEADSWDWVKVARHPSLDTVID